ncbi:MAG: hypothetical protein COV45_08820 [Deltaproteobacteria bacterium CG11_big_fil_rev_8_21_14_0_20_47_16]|nr:MAG: hypothetical protein COV45_08820 [Deltaproteobacteria bacterium CG11_big_fil_rev_8_21_14_0_20_47_16]
MKRLNIAIVMGLVLGLAASASAFDVGGAMKNAANNAAKKGSQAVVESQINNDLAKTTCACNSGKIDEKCLAKVAAKLKTEHALAEKNGFADFNIHIDADKTCAKSAETQMTTLVGWADTYVNAKKNTKTLSFSVKLN